MNEIDLGDDDGFVTFVASGARVRLDLFAAQARLLDYHEQAKSKSNEEYACGLARLVADLGIPSPSHKMAARFMQRVFDACSEQKKSTAAPVASPVSTASTHAA